MVIVDNNNNIGRSSLDRSTNLTFHKGIDKEDMNHKKFISLVKILVLESNVKKNDIFIISNP